MKAFKDLFHPHAFNEPIVSRYISFSTRDVIYECRCGKRVSKRISNTLNFPIATSSITKEEFNIILENKIPHNLHKVNNMVIFVEY